MGIVPLNNFIASPVNVFRWIFYAMVRQIARIIRMKQCSLAHQNVVQHLDFNAVMVPVLTAACAVMVKLIASMHRTKTFSSAAEKR